MCFWCLCNTATAAAGATGLLLPLLRNFPIALQGRWRRPRAVLLPTLGLCSISESRDFHDDD